MMSKHPLQKALENISLSKEWGWIRTTHHHSHLAITGVDINLIRLGASLSKENLDIDVISDYKLAVDPRYGILCYYWPNIPYVI